MAKGKVTTLGPRRDDIVALLEQGMADDEIMTITGWCPALVQRIRHRMGIKHERYLTRDDLYAVIAILINTDRPFAQVGKDAHVTGHCVSTIASKLSEAGIAVKPRKTGRPRKL